MSWLLLDTHIFTTPSIAQEQKYRNFLISQILVFFSSTRRTITIILDSIYNCLLSNRDLVNKGKNFASMRSTEKVSLIIQVASPDAGPTCVISQERWSLVQIRSYLQHFCGGHSLYSIHTLGLERSCPYHMCACPLSCF